MTAGRARNLFMACVVVLAATTAGGEPATAASRASAGSAAKVSNARHLMRTFGRSRSAATAATATAAARALTNGSGPLVYQGGPVQVQPKVYLDFWGTEWTNGIKDAGGYDGAAAQSYIQDFLRDISGSPWFNSQTQYCDGMASGVTTCPSNVPHVGTPSLGGMLTDPGVPVPTDASVAAEAEVAAAQFGLNQAVNATVLVLTPSGQSYFSSGGQTFCAYHSATLTNVIYGYIPWMPDLGAECAQNAVNASNDTFGHGWFDGFSIAIGHEVAEAANDPIPGAGRFGWIDSSGLETGDKCEYLAAWPLRNAYFGAGNTNFFAVQPLWSNIGESCPFEALGGLSSSHAAAASWGASHRDVFVRGGDNALWYRRWDGTGWSHWTWLGGFLTSAPSAVSWGVGRTDVFGRGGDNALWHIAWTGAGWSGWEWLGGRLISGPGAASWTSGRLDVVAVGGDRAMWHRRWNGAAWSSWEWLGGGLNSDPSAVSWGGSDRVDVFARGLDGELWQDAWTGSGWSGWLARGGVFAGGPGVTSTAAARLQVYGIGTDGGLWHEVWNGSAWSGWSTLEGQWPADPAAVSPPGSDSVELFMIGADAAAQRMIEGP